MKVADAKMQDANHPDYLGGHVAVNLLNTSRMRGGLLVDTLTTDADVRSWLMRMGLPEPVLERPLREGVLLAAARHLRDVLRESVDLRKAGKRVLPNELNRLLAASRSHLSLSHTKDHVHVTRNYKATNAVEFLAPLTEEIADLLANNDFDLVRQCEGDACVLWFLDRTKSGNRRWCVAESCGTRARVAAFRARKAAAASSEQDN